MKIEDFITIVARTNKTYTVSTRQEPGYRVCVIHGDKLIYTVTETEHGLSVSTFGASTGYTFETKYYK